MKIDDSIQPNSAKCGSIKLFIQYIQGQLSREQERQVDKHCEMCIDCRMNLAYVEEILSGKESLSTDEQTLLLKYIKDPVCLLLIENTKKELINEVKLLLQNSTNNPINTSFNTKDEPKTVIDKINKSASDHAKPKNSGKPITKPIYQQYSHFIAAGLILLFCSLSIGTYFIFTGKTQSSLASAPIISSNPLSITSSISSTPSQNLYQQLDIAIDQYLSTYNNDYLEESQDLAETIYTRYKDKYGTDLVAYYRLAPVSILQNLALHRKTLTQLSNQANGDGYQERLNKSQKLVTDFISLGNVIEAYKTKVLIAKLNVKLVKYDEAKAIIDNCLEFTRSHRYIFLQGYFLLWQAKRLTEVGEFNEVVSSLKNVIDIGNSLGIEELIISPSMSLAAVYQNNDYNQEALETAQQTLAIIKNNNLEYTISLLQMSGIAACNLRYYALSNTYLTQAIKLSEKMDNTYFLSLSYSFLSLTLAQTKSFAEADQAYAKAQAAAQQIEEKNSRLILSSTVLGYYAKLKMQQGNFQQAKELYQEALNSIETINTPPNLKLYELNEGLAIALQKLGESGKAKQYIAIAKTYQKDVESSSEKTNCLLSFIPACPND